MQIALLFSYAHLAMQAPVAAPGPENWAYVNCMISAATQAAQEGHSETAFKRHLEGECQKERITLRHVIVRKQIASGHTSERAHLDADVFFAVILKQMLSLRPVKSR